MGLLYYFVDLFINTFGITRPSEKARKQAAFFILTLILLAICSAVAAFAVLRGIIK